MSLTDHKTIAAADLHGPMTKDEFLERLENSYETPVHFTERHKSIRPSNPLSYLESGWIVATPGPLSVLLYDSVQNPAAYVSSMNLTTAWICGRHVGQTYYFRKNIRG
jgi:hypothetical protein